MFLLSRTPQIKENMACIELDAWYVVRWHYHIRFKDLRAPPEDLERDFDPVLFGMGIDNSSWQYIYPREVRIFVLFLHP